MPFFSATVEAVLAGRTVRRARLVKFDFLSGARRLFEGEGILTASDGMEWYGGGVLASIGDIESARGAQASMTEFTLSGVDQNVLASGLDAGEQAKGREVSVYCQHFDSEWRPLDGLYETFGGVMDTLKIKATGAETRTVTLAAEGIFTTRGFAPFAYLSDRDQKRLHPGDRGAEFVASMADKSIYWPVF